MTLHIDARALAAALANLAFMRREVAGLRRALALKFDPNQPRVPAGNPKGGEWTREVSFDVAQNRQPPPRDPYFRPTRPALPYSLVEDEGVNGSHTIRRHAGRGAADLEREVLQERANGALGPRAGSFGSIPEAERVVNDLLQAHRRELDAVATGRVGEIVLRARYASPIGLLAEWDDANGRAVSGPAYGAVLVARHDRSRARGYRVHTAYPTNFGPGSLSLGAPRARPF